MLNRWNLTLIAALLSGILLANLAEADQGRKGKNNPSGKTSAVKVQGMVIAVGTASVTIHVRTGSDVAVKVDSATKIERNDRHVTLSEIKVGDRGEAVINPATFLASKVESIGP